jgi:hypothetical protein
MNTFSCRNCSTEVSFEKRGHDCAAVRSVHGEMVSAYTAYIPNYPKSSRQSTQPGYMKQFGSRATK